MLIACAWLIHPAYEFIAHKDKLPMLPIGFIDIPKLSPIDQEVFDSHYQVAGMSALEKLSLHKVKINAPAISAAVAIDGEPVWAGAVGCRLRFLIQ